jgi:hypothetical protein|tara:strand:+ start:1178 stop:1564 length:387 start_codon:yes stop_codon:yes gene_type:complete
MAIASQTLVDSDFELVTKHTISGTNGTALKVIDASALSGAATDPRLSIVSLWWTVSSITEIEWDATSNVTAFSINTNGSYNAGGQALPSIANNAGSGITGDIYIENDAACIGTVIIKCKKVSGWDNIT